MADNRVASRYVKSLLGLAVEQGAVEAVNTDMKLFLSVCHSNRAFLNMLRSPIIKHDKKKAVLDALFTGKVNALTMSIFEILTRKNREPLLPAIANEFAVAYNEYKGIEKATVTTTFPIDPKLKADLEAIVKKLSTRKQVELVEKVDKDLIGGFILNVGDRQIDASVKSKLKSLKVKFSENPYVKEF
jgi:F-type H+-transporting ATPase subunit delta